MTDRLYLSPPDIGSKELEYVRDAFETNWIAPVGPHVDAFEKELAAEVGVGHAVAVSSGTAALHLALRLSGIEPGDEVVVSTFTFCASVNPILYQGATPVFVDSERTSWNMDPDLLAELLRRRAASGDLPKAVVLVHLYGQCADIDRVAELCEAYAVVLVEDAAEALGATYRGRPAGGFGAAGIFSFNGNKIITTAGGGMLVTDDAGMAREARELATQARDDAPHYEHSRVGFNYRMSNVLAAIGRGQLERLDAHVERRRRNFAYYREHLGGLPGIEFMPEASWGRSTRWLTCLTIDAEDFGTDREGVRRSLERENIEARPVWKPMHLQPVYRSHPVAERGVAEDLFARGLCLPSGSGMSERDLERVVDAVRRAAARA